MRGAVLAILIGLGPAMAGDLVLVPDDLVPVGTLGLAAPRLVPPAPDPDLPAVDPAVIPGGGAAAAASLHPGGWWRWPRRWHPTRSRRWYG